MHIVVALAAWLTGRPCRMVWTRREHALAGVKRHPYQIRLRTAATWAGDLLALDAHIVSDTGAYAVFGDSILELTVENIAALYRIPNIRIHAWAAYTNNPVGGAFRGFGATQGCLALEGNMSQMARQLGMDQVAFRERNLLEQGEQAALGHTIYLPFAVGDVFQAAARHPAWTEREAIRRPEGRIRRGVGMAVSMKGYGLGLGDMPDWGTADIEVMPDGRLSLGVGIVDIGQGSFTAMAQMAAEVLQMSPSQIDVHAADTGVNTDAGTTAASRVTYAVGRAVVDVAEALARQLKAEAATHWGVPAEEVALGDGMLQHEATGRNMACADLAPMRAEAKTRAPTIGETDGRRIEPSTRTIQQ